MAFKCRCDICGRKDAGKKRNRRESFRLGVTRDEHGFSWDHGSDRRAERRLLRRRAGRAWRREAGLL